MGQRCAAGACVDDVDQCQGDDCPCLSDADCGRGEGCDEASGRCFELECVIDNDCGLGAVCLAGRCETDVEADRDRDGVPDTEDSCPDVQNADQEDNDGDRRGDACDLDDDEDGRADTIDNCPRRANPMQGDADGDGVGNLCDEDTPGIGVRGSVDFSAVPGADVSLARVSIVGLPVAAGVERDGTFVFAAGAAVLAEPGIHLLRVEWPGFVTAIGELVAPDGQTVVEAEPIVMVPVAAGQDAARASGRVGLEGLEVHSDIIVRARVGGSLVGTTLTDERGGFVLDVPPVDLSLQFSKEGFETLEVSLQYHDQGEHAGRFTLDDVALEEVGSLVLERHTGTASISVEMAPAWIPQGQRAVTVTVIGDRIQRSAVANGAPVAFTDLPAGAYIAFADRPGFSQGRQSFTIDQRQPTANLTLTVELRSLAEASVDLSGATLSGEELRAVPNLRGANLAGVRLVGANEDTPAQLCLLDLSGASLVGADLSGADLQGVRLEGARLDNARLAGAQLRGVDLTGASLFGANLDGVSFVGGTFLCQGQRPLSGRTRLRGANLSSASLVGARFVEGRSPGDGQPCQRPSLTSPDLSGVRWNQTDLTDAIMHSTALEGASFASTIMTRADLRGACLDSATLLRVDMTGAQLRDADLSRASVLDALLLNAQLVGAVLEGASFSGVNLTDASLAGVQGAGLSMAGILADGATFEGADLEGSRWVGLVLSSLDFSGAVLDGADMRNVQMVDVAMGESSLVGTDLRNALLSQLDVSGVDFSGARLGGANFVQANLEGASFSGVDLVGVNFQLARYSTLTTWPVNFEFRTVGALGPEAVLRQVLFPNGFDARGVDLSGADLSGARMIGVDLSDATLTGAVLSGADVTGVNLGGADSTGLRGHDLSGCPATLPDAWVCRGRALLGPSADLSGLDLSGVSLAGLDLRGANLSGATLVGSWLSETMLQGANLDGVKAHDVWGGPADSSRPACPASLPDGWQCVVRLLGGAEIAPVIGTTLTGPTANLSGLKVFGLRSCPLIPEGWRCFETGRAQNGDPLFGLAGPGADMSDFDLGGRDLSDLDLRGGDLGGADLRGANLSNLRAFDLLGCPRQLAPLWQCVAQPANDRFALAGPTANLEGADLSNADLRHVDLTGARVLDADLSGADLEGADLSGVALKRNERDNVVRSVILHHARTVDLQGCPSLGIIVFGESEFVCAPLLNGRFVLLFDTVDLSGADISGVDLGGISLAGANLTGVRAVALQGCPEALPSQWRCVIQTTRIVLAGPTADLTPDQSSFHLRFFRFQGDNLTEADLSGADLENGSLANATLIRASLRGTDLKNVNMTGANLSGADLEGAQFDDRTICPDGRTHAVFPRCGF